MVDHARVLVLGDGDLSFSAALHESAPDLRMVATTFESREELLRRYACAHEHIAALEEAGAIVLHEVDATRLQTFSGGDGTFQRIIFNFPYQAFGGIKGLRRLLGQFFEGARLLLSLDGCIEVALCAGQGGTSLDGARGWAGSWRVPLLAARAQLALICVEPWVPPKAHRFHYRPMREPGNKDSFGGGGGKAFPTDGALLHRLRHCPRPQLAPRGTRAEALYGTLYGQRLQAAAQALTMNLPEAQWQSETPLPSFPGLAGSRSPSLRHREEKGLLGQPPYRRLSVQCTEGALVDAVAGMAKIPAEQLRWVADQGQRCLEVLVQRPDFTPCFPATIRVPKEDWLRLCWCEDSAVEVSERGMEFDLEVLAMLQLNFRDRRQLALRPPLAMCQCLFFHDLRVVGEVAETKIMDIIYQVCGPEILLEAFELEEVDGVPEGQRHWRLFFASVASALDEQTAYGAYQAVREAVRAAEMTLC
ncbi:unnamed protein product [Durusdinium trenchii]|uniref:25S rRNA (uridine-N(3))-methyltransferase BMT5-like domain-containing protein n=1 Tax=Durusdinium trenchii TaxID=1381693 RepID=A0ABP0RLT6_9DINO